MAPIFHLSLSVSDLEATRVFYERAFGAKVGRSTGDWIDIWLFSAQLTAYRRPAAVTPSPYREAQHFGATVSWDEWADITARAGAAAGGFAAAPILDDAVGTAKAMVADPDGYLIEIKAYRDPVAMLVRPEEARLAP